MRRIILLGFILISYSGMAVVGGDKPSPPDAKPYSAEKVKNDGDVLIPSATRLIALNSVRVMIADKEPQPILFQNKDCFYQADASSITAGVIEFKLNSVTCGTMNKEVNSTDNAPTLYFTKARVATSSIVIGVINELSIGATIEGSQWQQFEIEVSDVQR